MIMIICFLVYAGMGDRHWDLRRIERGCWDKEGEGFAARTMGLTRVFQGIQPFLCQLSGIHFLLGKSDIVNCGGGGGSSFFLHGIEFFRPLPRQDGCCRLCQLCSRLSRTAGLAYL